MREVEDHLADGWTYRVEIRIAGPFKDVAPCVPRTLGRLEASGDDSCTLRGSTDELTWYAAQLAAIPAPFTVVAGDEVRAAVRALGQRLVNAGAHG